MKNPMIITLITLVLAALPVFCLFSPIPAKASALSGLILLDVEQNGEAWYVYPEDKKRYYLGRPHDAFAIMRGLGLGISEVNFQKLAKAGMAVDGDLALARRLAGRIIIQAEKNGEAWYVYPKDLKIYYLGRPHDAFAIMRGLGLGITRENLAKIHKPALSEQLDAYSGYEHKKIMAQGREYSLDLVTIDTRDPELKIITAAADQANCRTNCQAKSLGKFVSENNGFAGINGTYFEAYDKNKLNYYFYPVYDSAAGVLVNEDQLKYWTTGPIFAWDENNNFHYFKDSREFGSLAAFAERHGVKLQAALGNRPRLIEKGMNLLIEWDIEDRQRDIKAVRNAIGIKDNFIYLVVARAATVPDLADIMQALGVDYALNLDGGYSSALWYNDEYMAGPGRNIPNALLFAKKKN